MSCGEEGGPESGLLNKPLRLEVDDQGNVYVMDYGDVNIKVYDAKGQYLRAIGRQGQGPGEFGGMVYFKLLSGGRLAALDFMQSRVTIMMTDGRYMSGFHLDGFYRTLAVDGQDRLFLAKWAAVREPDKLSTDFQEVPYLTSIFRTDVEGKNLVHLADLPGEFLVVKASGGGAVSMGGTYAIVWNVGRDGKIYGGYNGDYVIGAYGENGDKELSFGREFTPVKNARYRDAPGQRKTMPAYQNFVIDEAGNLWIELYQGREAKGFVYDVFSPDGTYLNQVSIETRIGVFKNGRIYSLLRSADEYPSIKRYKMELVPAGK
jgi:hypothetical protein